MTCREKLKIEHPGCIDTDYSGGCCGCPSNHGYLDDPEYCNDSRVRTFDEICTRCWDREIPETENIEEAKETMNESVKTKETKAELLNKIADLKKEVEKLDKYRQYEQVADELAAMRDALTDKGFTREEAMQFIFNAQKAAKL